MQITDAERNVIASHEIAENAAELLHGYLKNPRVASIAIGRVPLVGQEVEISGLIYSVIARNGKEIKLKLKG